MLGIIPAAGAGQRIQPLGCSKELLPVGSRLIKGTERPKAVAEYLVERMIAAGAEQICMASDVVYFNYTITKLPIYPIITIAPILHPATTFSRRR